MRKISWSGSNKHNLTLSFTTHPHMSQMSCSERNKKQHNQHGIDCFSSSMMLNQEQRFTSSTLV